MLLHKALLFRLTYGQVKTPLQDTGMLTAQLHEQPTLQVEVP